jgi:hypothetical protein
MDKNRLKILEDDLHNRIELNKADRASFIFKFLFFRLSLLIKLIFQNLFITQRLWKNS